MLKCWLIRSTYMRENRYIYSVFFFFFFFFFFSAISQETTKVVEGLDVVVPNVQRKLRSNNKGTSQDISQKDN
jgi:hypothetical protein